MSTKIKHQISSRIQELKDKNGWSWEKLAYSAGVSKSAICQIKNEQNAPSIITLIKICTVFGISLSEFFNFNIDTSDL